MKNYTGTKTVNATPMNRLDYNDYRGWELPADEDGADEGYLVEYTDGGKANDSRHAGYISWSPKEQFDRAYQENPTSVEQEIQRQDRATHHAQTADLQDNIASEYYFTAAQGAHSVWLNEPRESQSFTADDATGPLSLLTFCVLILKNGFTVTGESACASPENFDAEIGRKIARDNAIQKIWPLMGYALKSELARPVLTEADAEADLAGTPRPARA